MNIFVQLQILILPSSPQLAIMLPSGLNLTSMTAPSCASFASWLPGRPGLKFLILPLQHPTTRRSVPEARPVLVVLGSRSIHAACESRSMTFSGLALLSPWWQFYFSYIWLSVKLNRFLYKWLNLQKYYRTRMATRPLPDSFVIGAWEGVVPRAVWLARPNDPCAHSLILGKTFVELQPHGL